MRFLYGLSFKYVVLKDLKNIETTVEQTKVDGCSYRCPLIVLVIGESYDKAHSHVYNPSYSETTPQLSALQDSGNLFLFDNAITSHNHTTEAFREMFSTYSFDGSDAWTNHTLFPAVFKKAGYDVCFLSNQFATDFDDIWNHFGGTLFNSRKLSELQFTYRNRNVYDYDGQLIEEIPDVEVLRSKPTLLIVHFIGQHVDYAERYPEEFRKFTPEDVNPQFGGDIAKQVVANYDNSIYYNDFVVGSIMQKVSGTDAICIYLADHGEEVYDWRDTYMRTDESELLPEVAHYQFEIPFMVYLSDSFKVNHADLTKTISESTHKKIMNKDLSHILLDLGGIETPEYNAKYDCFSDEYDNEKERIIRDRFNFDEVISNLKLD
ncbi:MAG: phosphoethanolamine transferase [Bacteroidales bacterium]|nr:phosphoethanolamine transferase [Bacteroidales bacterium]